MSAYAELVTPSPQWIIKGDYGKEVTLNENDMLRIVNQYLKHHKLGYVSVRDGKLAISRVVFKEDISQIGEI